MLKRFISYYGPHKKMMVLDMLAIYAFTSERLRVLAICLAVILLPFFSEVTVKNFAVKRWPAKEEGDT